MEESFFCVVYVDKINLVRVQQIEEDHSALKVSSFIALDCLGLFEPGIAREIPILAPTKTSHWDIRIEYLGWIVNTYQRTYRA